MSISTDNTTPTALTAENFQCDVDGNINDATFQWSVTPDDGTYSIAAATAKATNITFNAAKTYNVTCKVSSATAQNSPVTSAPTVVNVVGLTGLSGVTLGGPQTVTELNVGKNYTSSASSGQNIQGTTTYQWTAEDDNTKETSGIGVVIATPNDQDTSVTYTSNALNRTIALRCKWTNAAYSDSPKTGKRNVVISGD